MTADLRELEAMLAEEESALAHANDVTSEDGLIRRLFKARRAVHEKRVTALKAAIQSLRAFAYGPQLRSGAQLSSGGGSPTPSDETARPGPQCPVCHHAKHEKLCPVQVTRWGEVDDCDCIA